MVKEIPLTQGKVTVVDDEDFEYLNQWKWHYHSAGYGARDVWVAKKKRKLYIHREILQTPEHLVTDHINGNRLDNRKQNLRACSHQQNLRNTKGRGRAYKGLSKHGYGFSVRIGVNGEDIYIGCFVCENAGAKAYNAAAIKYFEEFAFLNELKECTCAECLRTVRVGS